MADELADAYVTILPDMDRFTQELAAKLEAATSALRPNVDVDAKLDAGQLDAEVAAADAALDSLTDKTVGIHGNLAPLLGDLAGIQGLQSAMPQLSMLPQNLQSQLTVNADTAPALTDARAAASAISGLNPKMHVGADTTDIEKSLGGGGFLSSLLGLGEREASGSAAGGAGGAAPTTAGMMASLFGRFFGGGFHPSSAHDALYGGDNEGFASGILSPATFFTKLFSAGFGSVGSLAGFGPEHLLTTLLGVGGLGVAGGAGGGLLAGGSLLKSGVGSGSDFLVDQTLKSNLSNVETAQKNLNTAIAQYGPLSTQAAAAQNAYNAQLNMLPPIARQAVAGLASAMSAMKSQWQVAAAPAEALAATLQEKFIGLAENYIPQVASAATRNFGIMNTALNPLLNWLEGPAGHGIFANLENEFASQLPTAIHAFSQGLELVLKTLNYASTFTGGFVTHLDQLLTKLNGADFGKVEAEVRKLITDFHIVDDFLKILGKDLVDIFKNDAGTATALVQLLTGALQNLGKWINSVAGSHELQNLFSVHRTELLDLLKAMEPLLVNFGKAYLAMAPALVSLVSELLQFALALYEVSQKIPGLAQLVDLGLVLLIFEKRSGLVTTSLHLLKDAFQFGGMFGQMIEGLGGAASEMLGFSAAEDVATVSSTALDIALGVGVIGALVAVGVGIYELATHWQQVWGDIKNWFDDAVEFIRTHALIILAAFGPIIGGALLLAANWQTVWAGMKEAVNDFVGFFTAIPGEVSGLASEISSGITTAGSDIASFFEGLPGKIESVFSGAGDWLLQAGKDIVDGLKNGFVDAWNDFKSTVDHYATDVKGWVEDALGIHSPPDWAIYIGTQIPEGIANGMVQNSGSAINSAKTISAAIEKAFGTAGETGSAATAVKNFANMVGNLSSVFTNLASAVTASGKITATGIQQMVTALNQLTNSNIMSTIQQLENAFSNLGVPKQVQANMTSLASVIGNLKDIFTDFDQIIASAGKLNGTALLALAVGLQNLGKAATMIQGPILGMMNALSNLGSLKQVEANLGALKTVLSDVSQIFTNFAKIAQQGSQLSSVALLALAVGLQNLEKAAALIGPAITQVTNDLSNMGVPKNVTAGLSDFINILGELNTILTTFSKISQDASQLSGLAMLNIVVALDRISSIAPAIEGAVMSIGNSLSNMGKLDEVESNLNNFSKILDDLIKAVQNVASLSSQSSATSVTAFTNLGKAATDLGSSFTQMAGATSQATSQVTADVGTMVSGVSSALSGLSGIGYAAGASIDQGLVAGINAGSNAVGQAAHAAAQNAVNATNNVVKPGSPSRTFTLIGLNMMEGLAQGITQGMNTHVLPAITSAATMTVAKMSAAGATIATGAAVQFGSEAGNGGIGGSGGGVNVQLYNNPNYQISGEPSQDTINKMQALHDRNTNQLINEIYARGGTAS